MKWLVLGISAALLCTSLAYAQSAATIVMRDACDPDSFNATVGPGTCIAGAHGTTLFPDFIAELQEDHIAGAWRFNPLLDASQGHFKLVRLKLHPGEPTTIENKGGETHTFTRVREFGGGFIGVLNGLSENPSPAPECAQVLPDGSLAPQPESDTNQFVEAGKTEAGPTAGSSALPHGVSRWECCIHPWMRMLVVVKGEDD
jgi:hypothetical protein